MKRRTCAMVLAGVLACGMLSGCSMKPANLDGTQVAVEVGEEQADLGSLASMVRYQQALTYDQYMSMMEQYTAAGYPVNTSEMWSGKLSDEDKESYQESVEALGVKTGLTVKTVGDRLLDSTVSVLASYMVASQHADEFGVSLSEDDHKKIADVADKFLKNTDKAVIESNGITKDSVVAYLEYFTLANRVKASYEAAQQVEISDEEAKTMDISFLRFPVNTNVEDSKEEGKKLASEYLDKYKKDSSYTFEKAIESDYSDATTGHDSVFVHAEDGSYIFSSDDIKALEKLSVGDVYDKVIEGPDGYYVVRMENPFDKDVTAKQKETLVQAQKESMYQETLSKWMKDSKIAFHPDVIDDIVISDRDIYTSVKDSDDSEEVEQDIVVGEDASGTSSSGK